MVLSFASKRVLFTLAVLVSTCTAYVGHQTIMGGSFVRQYSRGLSYFREKRLRSASQRVKTQMGLRDEQKLTPGALSDALKKDFSDTSRDNFQYDRTRTSPEMSRHEPAAISSPHSAATPKILSAVVNEQSQSKEAAQTAFLVRPYMLGLTTSKSMKRDNTRSKTTSAGRSYSTSYSQASSKPSAANPMPSPQFSHQRREYTSIVRTWRPIDVKPAVRTWRVGASILSTPDASARRQPLYESSTPTTSSNIGCGAEKIATRTWRVGAVMVSSSTRPAASATSATAAARPVSSWSRLASPPAAPAPAAPSAPAQLFSSKSLEAGSDGASKRAALEAERMHAASTAPVGRGGAAWAAAPLPPAPSPPALPRLLRFSLFFSAPHAPTPPPPSGVCMCGVCARARARVACLICALRTGPRSGPGGERGREGGRERGTERDRDK
jgi:hypothetical protein